VRLGRIQAGPLCGPVRGPLWGPFWGPVRTGPSVQRRSACTSPGSWLGSRSRLAERSGLAFCSREVALLCGLKDDRLALRASFFQLYHQRAGTIERMLLIGHEDVLVFKRKTTPRKPASR
jgi:hypothetical protein